MIEEIYGWIENQKNEEEHLRIRNLAIEKNDLLRIVKQETNKEDIKKIKKRLYSIDQELKIDYVRIFVNNPKEMDWILIWTKEMKPTCKDVLKYILYMCYAFTGNKLICQYKPKEIYELMNISKDGFLKSIKFLKERNIIKIFETHNDQKLKNKCIQSKKCIVLNPYWKTWKIKLPETYPYCTKKKSDNDLKASISIKDEKIDTDIMDNQYDEEEFLKELDELDETDS